MTERKTKGKVREKVAIQKSGDHRSLILKNLMKKKEEVEKTLNRMRDSQNEQKGAIFGDDSVEEFDRAEKEVSAQMYFGLLERKSQELIKLEKLITKILQNEDFGYCEECGERISPQRLLVMPEATMCIACQSEAEKFWTKRDNRLMRHTSPRLRVEWEEGDVDESNLSGKSLMKQGIAPLSLDELEELDIEDKTSEKQKNLHLRIRSKAKRN